MTDCRINDQKAKSGIYRIMNSSVICMTVFWWILSVRLLLSYPEYFRNFLHPHRDDAAVLLSAAVICIIQWIFCGKVTEQTVLLTPLLAAGSAQDLQRREIPDLCPILMIIVSWKFICPEGFLTAALFSAVLSLFARNGMMGFGDVKLIAAFSLSAGTHVFTATAFASFLVLITSAVKKEPPERQIPFAPFLSAGFILVLFIEAAG